METGKNIPPGAEAADGLHAIDEIQQASANSIRWLGLSFLGPLVVGLFLLELRANRADLPLTLELVAAVVGAIWLLFAVRASPMTRGLVGTVWLATIIVTAQAHFGLTAGLAAGWVVLVLAAQIFFRWRGSILAIALQLFATLGTAAGIMAGWWNTSDFSPMSVTVPWVLFRMGLVIGGAMIAMAVAHENLLVRLERWEQQAREARERQRHAEREHARAVAALENAQRLESVGRMASGAAHDVNNALTIIMGNAELLGWAAPEEASELRQEILTAATNASRTTSQLMTIARGAIRDTDEQPVGRIVESLGDLIRRLLPSDVTLDVTVAGKRDVRVETVEFQQILLHLIANARDAIVQKGSVSITVEDDPDSDAGVTVSVADNGRGWDLEAVARAFDPPGDRGTGAFGLGLGPARAFAFRYSGSVRIESEVGFGTRILLHLGCARGALGEMSSGSGATPAPALPGLAALCGRPVLVAEDEEPVRRLIVTYLQEVGATLTVVQNAVEARAALLKEPYDLFITDAVMPSGGTMDAVDEFHRRNRHGHVLVVSGHVREELVRRGIESGTVAFLAKPFSRSQLLEAIARLIGAGARSGHKA